MKTAFRNSILFALVSIIVMLISPICASAKGYITFNLSYESEHNSNEDLYVSWSGSSGNSKYFKVTIKALSGAPDPQNYSEPGTIIGGYNGLVTSNKSATISKSSFPSPGKWIKVYVDGLGSDQVTNTDTNSIIYIKIIEERKISISPTSISVNASASQKTVSVTSNSEWQAIVPYSCDDWISVSKETGSGNSSIVVSIDANPNTTSRSGYISISLTSTYTADKVTITQAGKASNSLTISPKDISATATKGQYTVSVTSDTSWVVDTTVSWLTVNKTSGSKNGSVTVTAAANTSASSRKGYVYIDSSDGKIERTVTVTQAGSTSLSVSPTSVSVDASASQKTISVTSNTDWQAVVPYSCDDWISINKETGSGNGSIVVYIDENPSTASRTGSVSVLLTSTYTEKEITITQAGKASNSLTISPTTVSATATKGQYTVNVTSNTSWVVDTSSSWLTVNKTSGSGNGSVTVTAAANTTTSSRKGYVYIDSSDGKLGEKVTVTQAAGTVNTLTVSPDKISATASKG